MNTHVSVVTKPVNYFRVNFLTEVVRFEPILKGFGSDLVHGKIVQVQYINVIRMYSKTWKKERNETKNNCRSCYHEKGVNKESYIPRE